MANFESVLAGIPGYGGYLAKERYNRQNEAGDVQQVAALSSLLGGVQQQKMQQEQIAQTAKLKDVLSNLTPEQTSDPRYMKSLFLQHANPHDALMALSKNPMEGMPELVKLSALSKQARAAGDTGTADLIDAKLKKDTSTETSKEQENINFLTDLSLRARSGKPFTEAEATKATAIYRMMNAPRFDPATGQTYTPNMGAQFDPERHFGLSAPGAKLLGEGGSYPDIKVDGVRTPEPRMMVTEPTKPVLTDIKEDGRGGYVGFNKNTGKMEKVVSDVAPPTKPLKDIPQSTLNGMMENNRSLVKIDQALNAIQGKQDALPQDVKADKAATGFKGYLPNAILSRVDPQGVDARALIADIGSLKIHDRSGAAVTASESPRLMPFIPLATDDPATVVKKLNNFKREYSLMQQEAGDYYNEANGFKPYKPASGTRAPGRNVMDEADAILKGG